jgi:hypothetical protein
MTTPQFEIDRLNETLRGENIEFLRDDVAFGVAHCIVEYNDPDLLKQFPSWVGELVREMCDEYRHHGHYGIISNLGEADHSEMVGKLVKLLEASES